MRDTCDFVMLDSLCGVTKGGDLRFACCLCTTAETQNCFGSVASFREAAPNLSVVQSTPTTRVFLVGLEGVDRREICRSKAVAAEVVPRMPAADCLRGLMQEPAATRKGHEDERGTKKRPHRPLIKATTLCCVGTPLRLLRNDTCTSQTGQLIQTAWMFLPGRSASG